MADVLRLSQHSLFPSPLLFPFQSSPAFASLSLPPKQNSGGKIYSVADVASAVIFRDRKRVSSFKVHATVVENEGGPKWWEKNAPNMIDIHSTEEFVSALSEAGDRLVIVEFYGTWCGSCRALFRKLCKTAEEHPEVSFLKVNFDENKPMCKRLNMRVLPYFHFYRGADGLVESFSCSLAKFQKIKDAIQKHNTALAHPQLLEVLTLGLLIQQASLQKQVQGSYFFSLANSMQRNSKGKVIIVSLECSCFLMKIASS